MEPTVSSESRLGGLAERRTRAGERSLEILVVSLVDASGENRERYGLLVSQVHSIVRLGEKATQLRVHEDGSGWELVYEGAWIPVQHLRQCLGQGPAHPERSLAHRGSVRILGIKIETGDENGTRGDPPRYVGMAVDDVVEIISCPLNRVLPFPRWLIKTMPRTTVWGAIPAEQAGTAGMLLLLDGAALAGQIGRADR